MLGALDGQARCATQRQAHAPGFARRRQALITSFRPQQSIEFLSLGADKFYDNII